jgi:hypothetical protein
LVLKQRLDDPIDGPSAACRSTGDVREAVQRDITALGLSGWSIEPAPGSRSADGTTLCAFAWVDEGAADTVLVQSRTPIPRVGNNGAFQKLLTRLRRDVASQCLTLTQARAATERAVADSGLTATISAAAVAGGRCTAIDMAAGGSLAIRLS